jgi:hypothetical protein
VVDLAVWEHKTDGVIKKNNLMKRYETLLQEAHQKLEQRRAKCVYRFWVFEWPGAPRPRWTPRMDGVLGCTRAPHLLQASYAARRGRLRPAWIHQRWGNSGVALPGAPSDAAFRTGMPCVAHGRFDSLRWYPAECDAILARQLRRRDVVVVVVGSGSRRRWRRSGCRCKTSSSRARARGRSVAPPWWSEP